MRQLQAPQLSEKADPLQHPPLFIMRSIFLFAIFIVSLEAYSGVSRLKESLTLPVRAPRAAAHRASEPINLFSSEEGETVSLPKITPTTSRKPSCEGPRIIYIKIESGGTWEGEGLIVIGEAVYHCVPWTSIRDFSRGVAGKAY